MLGDKGTDPSSFALYGARALCGEPRVAGPLSSLLLFPRSRPKAPGLSSHEINKTVARHVLTLPFCSSSRHSAPFHELQHASRSIRRRRPSLRSPRGIAPRKVAGIFRRHRASREGRRGWKTPAKPSATQDREPKIAKLGGSSGIRGTCSPTRVDRANSIVLP